MPSLLCSHVAPPAPACRLCAYPDGKPQRWCACGPAHYTCIQEQRETHFFRCPDCHHAFKRDSFADAVGQVTGELMFVIIGIIHLPVLLGGYWPLILFMSLPYLCRPWIRRYVQRQWEARSVLTFPAKALKHAA